MAAQQQQGGGIAAGVILGLFGLWVLLRTVVKGSNGKNLSDYLLGLGSGGSSSSSSDLGQNPLQDAVDIANNPLSPNFVNNIANQANKSWEGIFPWIWHSTPAVSPAEIRKSKSTTGGSPVHGHGR